MSLRMPTTMVVGPRCAAVVAPVCGRLSVLCRGWADEQASRTPTAATAPAILDNAAYGIAPPDLESSPRGPHCRPIGGGVRGRGVGDPLVPASRHCDRIVLGLLDLLSTAVRSGTPPARRGR